jgi:hypothetical protein
MDEIEVPLENAQEETMHHAHHSGERWIAGVALSSAILAVLAAITAMLAGHHANEAMMDQIHASDKWAYYQAKSIKSSLMQSKIDLFGAVGQQVNPTDQEKLESYKKEMEEISAEAKEREQESEHHMSHHQVYARGVTFFQVAIAIAAIAALTRKKHFWLVGLGFGVAGSGFLAWGLLV